MIFSALVLALLFSAASCTHKSITASGAKHSGYAKFNFRINNNQTSRASIYKRYVAHNRNFKALPNGHKRQNSSPAPNKRMLAHNQK
jgi:hypothetical protein